MDEFPSQHASQVIMTVINANIERRYVSMLLLWLEFSEISLVEHVKITHEVFILHLSIRYN
jgi:hypothetical protein